MRCRRRGRWLALLVSSVTAPAWAQEVHQRERKLSVAADGLLRQEWTVDVPQGDGQDRWRARLRPQLTFTSGGLVVGVGGDFAYSSDDNTEAAASQGEFGYGGRSAPLPPPRAVVTPLLRDNYRAREARLDLAFARIEPAAWLRVEGGRFEMPVELTEMIWDRDLRPQGGTVALQARDRGPFRRLGLTVLGAVGSHAFEDEDARLLLAAADASLSVGTAGRVQLVASYLDFSRLDALEVSIRRQNARVGGLAGGPLAGPYRIVDLVARFRWDGAVPVQVVADYCWNRERRDRNRGVWLAAMAGSTRDSHVRAEYTFARVDADATVAAYGADDFLWVTGWDGHRADLGVRLADGVALHTVAQLQRFKDSPRVDERDHWVKRLRVELRLSRTLF